MALTPGGLRRAFAAHEVTVAFLTSALFHRTAADDPRAFELLRCLLVGGEAVDPRRAREALSGGAPPGRLLDAYGPTEGTTFTTIHDVRRPPPEGVALPVGRPIANTRVHVVDRSGAPLPMGVLGEIAVGGDGLARGYRRPSGPDRRRASCPTRSPALPGARLYRTGDLGRLPARRARRSSSAASTTR